MKLVYVAKGGKRVKRVIRETLDTWDSKVILVDMDHEEIQENKDCEDIEENKVSLEKRVNRE